VVVQIAQCNLTVKQMKDLDAEMGARNRRYVETAHTMTDASICPRQLD
jgi:hypothetical protein